MKPILTGQETAGKNLMRDGRRPRWILSTMLLTLCVTAPLAFSGCGQTANPVVPASANQVYSYFGGPFNVAASDLPRSVSTFDHSADQINVSSFVTETTGQVPSGILSGTFMTAPTGFLNITENFVTTGSGVITAQNPPVPGAWAVEIPGVGALGNLLSVNTTGGGLALSAAPAAMAENTACPNFPTTAPAPFLYVTVPSASRTADLANYGVVDISTQGSAVTLNAQPYLIGPTILVPTAVTGGCSVTYYGPLTAYPLNSYPLNSLGSAPPPELISIAQSGFLVSSFTAIPGSSPGAFGGGTGVIGVAAPSNPVSVGDVIGAHYNGFIYAPQYLPNFNNKSLSYDITVLASAFGDKTAHSQACAPLQSSLPSLPSANSIYGGEFLTTTGANSVNDPTGANGSENCDVALDLGVQDPMNNGLFPHATVFIGPNYPPNSSQACPSAISFPAAAVVGEVQGQHVIFVAASAMLPDDSCNLHPHQPVGIYLFQKPQ